MTMTTTINLQTTSIDLPSAECVFAYSGAILDGGRTIIFPTQLDAYNALCSGKIKHEELRQQLKHLCFALTYGRSKPDGSMESKIVEFDTSLGELRLFTSNPFLGSYSKKDIAITHRLGRTIYSQPQPQTTMNPPSFTIRDLIYAGACTNEFDRLMDSLGLKPCDMDAKGSTMQILRLNQYAGHLDRVLTLSDILRAQPDYGVAHTNVLWAVRNGLLPRPTEEDMARIHTELHRPKPMYPTTHLQRKEGGWYYGSCRVLHADGSLNRDITRIGLMCEWIDVLDLSTGTSQIINCPVDVPKDRVVLAARLHIPGYVSRCIKQKDVDRFYEKASRVTAPEPDAVGSRLVTESHTCPDTVTMRIETTSNSVLPTHAQTTTLESVIRSWVCGRVSFNELLRAMGIVPMPMARRTTEDRLNHCANHLNATVSIVHVACACANVDSAREQIRRLWHDVPSSQQVRAWRVEGLVINEKGQMVTAASHLEAVVYDANGKKLLDIRQAPYTEEACIYTLHNASCYRTGAGDAISLQPGSQDIVLWAMINGAKCTRQVEVDMALRHMAESSGLFKTFARDSANLFTYATHCDPRTRTAKDPDEALIQARAEFERHYQMQWHPITERFENEECVLSYDKHSSMWEYVAKRCGIKSMGQSPCEAIDAVPSALKSLIAHCTTHKVGAKRSSSGVWVVGGIVQRYNNILRQWVFDSITIDLRSQTPITCLDVAQKAGFKNCTRPQPYELCIEPLGSFKYDGREWSHGSFKHVALHLCIEDVDRVQKADKVTPLLRDTGLFTRVKRMPGTTGSTGYWEATDLNGVTLVARDLEGAKNLCAVTANNMLPRLAMLKWDQERMCFCTKDLSLKYVKDPGLWLLKSERTNIVHSDPDPYRARRLSIAEACVVDHCTRHNVRAELLGTTAGKSAWVINGIEQTWCEGTWSTTCGVAGSAIITPQNVLDSLHLIYITLYPSTFDVEGVGVIRLLDGAWTCAGHQSRDLTNLIKQLPKATSSTTCRAYITQLGDWCAKNKAVCKELAYDTEGRPCGWLVNGIRLDWMGCTDVRADNNADKASLWKCPDCPRGSSTGPGEVLDPRNTVFGVLGIMPQREGCWWVFERKGVKHMCAWSRDRELWVTPMDHKSESLVGLLLGMA